MRIIQHPNHWADTVVQPQGYMQGKCGQRIEYHDLATRLLAVCLCDTEWYRLDRHTHPQLITGQLYIRRGGHRVLVRRLTGRHLKTAIRRLNQLRKTTRNDNPTNCIRD